MLKSMHSDWLLMVLSLGLKMETCKGLLPQNLLQRNIQNGVKAKRVLKVSNND